MKTAMVANPHRPKLTTGPLGRETLTWPRPEETTEQPVQPPGRSDSEPRS